MNSEKVKDHTICRLGKWYYGEGVKLFSNLNISAIRKYHKDFYNTCASLVII
ncbi:CZB domain-containing protein [Anaerobacillus sp. HL2]|nr:CZB domain-containing protein [Anaerobacillus sp. HL2]